jgi:hypothetical protein
VNFVTLLATAVPSLVTAAHGDGGRAFPFGVPVFAFCWAAEGNTLHKSRTLAHSRTLMRIINSPFEKLSNLWVEEPSGQASSGAEQNFCLPYLSAKIVTLCFAATRQLQLKF